MKAVMRLVFISPMFYPQGMMPQCETDVREMINNKNKIHENLIVN